MELPRRDRDDVFVPDGGYGQLVDQLRDARSAQEWSIVVAYPFDARTRVMPFRWVDRRVVPCGVRSLGAALLECGFTNTRTVLQQWTPKFSVSATVKSGRPIDVLMISSMNLHAGMAYRMIRDAHTLGDDRPLILMGGPKAIYEPEDCFGLPEAGEGADVACTGEEYVLLDFLRLLTEEAGTNEAPLNAFERLRHRGTLDEVPGLVYRAPQSPRAASRGTYLINTGVQRLVRDLDELPMPLGGMTCIEPAHRKRVLQPKSWPIERVRKKAFLASLVTTHGCRFNCDFCPIPAYQQRTWRFKSPERLADEIKQLGEKMRHRYFFGTDDNFFNDRSSVASILQGMANAEINGVPFRDSVHFVTEATEYDVFKNRDLLPLAHEAGLKTIYFGIEDLNAKLINKGQSLNKTEELFRELHANKIEAYAMMIHHDDQPLWSRQQDQLGVVNQAMRLFEMGAAGYHTTYIAPSPGARNVERMFEAGTVIGSVGGKPIPEAFQDGNHVIATRHRRAWVRQLQLWMAYGGFYNPVNFVRTLFKDLRNKHNRRRLKWQLIGGSMVLPSLFKSLPWLFSLMTRRVEKHPQAPPRCLPMIDAHTRQPIDWGWEAETPHEVELVPLEVGAGSLVEV